jgi:hypothetical protein
MKSTIAMFERTIVFVCLLSTLGCESEKADAGLVCSSELCLDREPPEDPKQTEQIGRCADHDPLRRAYFGETHIHTNRSLDAIALSGDTRLSASRVLSPEDSYRYARGEPVEIPTTLDGSPTETIQIERPLDFASVTDHAEFLGVAPMCFDPSSAAYDSTECENIRVPEGAPQGGGVLGGGSGPFFGLAGTSLTHHPICGDEGEDCLRYADPVWEEIQQAAESAYDRTDACSFATLVGYEWSLSPLGDNLHRNVFFRNEVVPARPISVNEAGNPPALWAELQKQCIGTDTACDVLAIPHNANRSQGRAFADDKNLSVQFFVSEPIDKAYAMERQRMEPLVEVYQVKGSSECNTMLSSDEECGFDSGIVAGFIAATTPPVETSFVRNALGLGLEHLAKLGVNPFQFGLIAATDAHNGRAGGAILDEVLAEERELSQDFSMNNMPNNSGGLAGVWAEENSREAIFVAMRRREAFGTSGPRIKPRFFSAWDLPASACDDPLAAIENAYDVGVPMGGKLSAPPNQTSVPQFLVMAEADVGAPVRGTVPLAAIQIIKVWLEDGAYQERVYDVAGEVSKTHTVDPLTCESTAPANAPLELCSVWTDPDFDPSQHATYYARVLEHSTCRHSTLTCNAGFDCDNPTTGADFACCNPRFGFERSICEADPPDCSDAASVPNSQRACCLPIVEPLVRQRAWTSPIWYEALATDAE